jgi:signal peptidase I
MTGDRVLGLRFSYWFNDPQRGDIVVFKYPVEYAQIQEMSFFERLGYRLSGKSTENYIKRIIGLPGETVEIEEDGTIYINGEVLPEEYGYGETTPQELTGEVVLGDDEYFVLGDNREISLDSRYAEVGNIPRSIIIGRAWLRLYPFSEFGLLTGK